MTKSINAAPRRLLRRRTRHHPSSVTEHADGTSLARRNLSVPELYEKALLYEHDTHLMANGALATTSGEKTGGWVC